MPVRDGPIVLDTSIAACWCLDDEVHPDADVALSRINDWGAVVPALFWFELRNVLLMGERRKRSTEARTAQSLNLIRQLDMRIDREPVESIVMSLARLHQLSVYDAAYLELALRQVCPLATLDGDLIKAAKAEKVELVGA
jgi:predicted nucleic acid-binding protein